MQGYSAVITGPRVMPGGWARQLHTDPHLETPAAAPAFQAHVGLTQGAPRLIWVWLLAH